MQNGQDDTTRMVMTMATMLDPHLDDDKYDDSTVCKSATVRLSRFGRTDGGAVDKIVRK